jgi:glyoxylase-like metal-dependent hydrolase (beta-lactamase superfamily II)
MRLISAVPQTYSRLIADETIEIGGRSFEILTGAGHAPEQVMLICREDRLFFAADQVLARISPNISVWAWEPDADPLGSYLASLEHLHEAVPDHAIVLPGHNLPFIGLQERVVDLSNHHERRCDTILAACAEQPLSAADLVPLVFTRPLDAQQTGFAFGEMVAHVNYLIRRGDLVVVEDADDIIRYEAG